MENLKIRVKTEQESKEAQELFFELGGDFYFGGKLYCNTHLELVTINKDGLMANIELDGFDYTEITLPQLRDMVKPKVKEYLTKNSSGNYQLVNHRFSEDDIEVPEGSEILTVIFGDKVFYKSGNPFKWFDMNTEEWRECSSAVEFDGFENKLWQRESPNDKVASAEVARREVFKPECFGAIDNVNNPQHYAGNGIECIDAMQAMLTPEQFVGYLRGNAFKYQWRYSNKGGIEDLKKSQWYLNKLIEVEAS